MARSRADSVLPHPLLVDAARAAIRDGAHERFDEYVTTAERNLLTRVVNATGVLLHTNMGRAPLAIERAAGYSNLELDLQTGERGSRQDRAGALLARACGAEAAIVVNNCAAAVMLGLAAVARGGAVPVSRGELVEIGGGFRVPEVLEQSGCRLIEVGTTNRTRIGDFERALETNDDVTAVLKVHPSNYRIEGFSESVSVRALADLDRPLIVDLGSGLLDESCPWLEHGRPSWLLDEPAVRQTLESGADLVMFSGDKLLGGPQCGIIAGKAESVAACSRHPLMRALRPGDLTIDALQQIALAYLRRQGNQIPFWAMATRPVAELEARAAAIVQAVGTGRVVQSQAAPGGGSLPTATIPSAAIELPGDHTQTLRAHPTPVVARVHEGRTLLDLRTVDPEEDDIVAQALTTLA